MSKRFVASLFLSILLFTLLIPIVNPAAVSPNRTEKKPCSYTTRSIAVSTDDDFNDLYWTGDGTAEAPYMLIPKMFYGTYIEIRNTVSHFVITDIIIETQPYYSRSIVFSNVKNGMLVNSTIKPFPKYSGPAHFPGIEIDKSSGIVIEDCIISESSKGLWIRNSSNSIITGNQILRNSIGIHIDESFNTSILGNKIIENAEYGIQIVEGSLNCTIISNYLGYNGVSNAIDDENSTSWDKDVHGNFWDDYDDSGVYNISGMGSNYDGFPLLLTQDASPPVVGLDDEEWFYPGFSTTVCWPASPGSVTPSFSATVIDESGIDSVYLCISDGNNPPKWYEMIDSSGNDRYVYTFADEYYDIDEVLFIWANDTRGNVWMSALRLYWYKGYTTELMPFADELSITYLALGIIITLTAGLIIRHRRGKRK
jgi:parallel beta-helix repeat protein